MYKAQNGGLGLQDRKKAKLITVMAVVILSIFILVGCSNPSGGPDINPPVPTVTKVTVNGAIVVVKDVSDVTKQYTAIVTGTNSPSQAVIWSIESGASDEVSISPTGLLTVESTASTGSIKIKATSTVAGYTNISGTIDVAINDSTDPTVTSVTIDTGAASVTKNESSNVTETYAATVTGTNSPSQVVIWSIDGNPTGVSISSGGVLTVESTADTGDITIRATSTVSGYTNISGIKVVTINAPSFTDFKLEANANLLGLYPGTNYENGSAVISAMDLRTGNISFYNPQINVPPAQIYGINGVKRGNIAGASPSMAWVFNENNLIVHGWDDINATIVFNVAVIKPDGTGWLKGDENIYFKSYTSAISEEISISDLTNNGIITGLGLSGCKMYVIVRSTSSASVVGDFNINSSYNLLNVIPVPF
jgi:hypothetical protein